MSSGRWLVSAQNPVHLDEYSEPQPDLMLLKPAPDNYTSRHPRQDDVFLLIEVADTTLVYESWRKTAHVCSRWDLRGWDPESPRQEY